jgi:putative transposase
MVRGLGEGGVRYLTCPRKLDQSKRESSNAKRRTVMPRKSQFTEQQIIRALQEVDAGATAADVCRRLGVAEATFYRWKSKYGGMDVSDAKRLKELEAENARLKKLVAEQALDLEAVRSVLRKKW